MTIAVSIKVGEGLVLAADSTSSYFSQGTLAQSYHHARKLLQLSDFPIGVLTYGLGNIAGRNLESLVAEFEREIGRVATSGNYTVQELSQRLHDFILAKYDHTFPPPALLPGAGHAPAGGAVDAPAPNGPNQDGRGAANPDGASPAGGDGDAAVPPAPPQPPAADDRPQLGVVVGGYSHDEFFPDEFQFVIPGSPPWEIWPDVGGKQLYGVRWWGQTAPIERLYLGCDFNGFVQWFVDNGVPEADAVAYYQQLRDRVMWPIIYEGMPIQDAIDLAVYLVNVTIGHSRFAVGPAVCGGPIDVATITSAGFRWVKRKDWTVKSDSVFF
ncbi:MAG: hypothetical protein Q8O42_15585 [Acidobacteriota bacterium]|nr:hypothetical protein [Acidobacteriota bacterium]